MDDGVIFLGFVAMIVGAIVLTSLVKHITKWLGGAYSRPAPSDPSMTAGELDRLVRGAVREETRALHAQIERLEERVDKTRRIEPPEDPHRYGLLADTESLGEPQKPA